MDYSVKKPIYWKVDNVIIKSLVLVTVEIKLKNKIF